MMIENTAIVVTLLPVSKGFRLPIPFKVGFPSIHYYVQTHDTMYCFKNSHVHGVSAHYEVKSQGWHHLVAIIIALACLP